MRIVGGCLKGRRLKLPSMIRNIRPTSDRTREAIYNLLGPGLHGERVLDLFAGTGALGIEALSRGYSLGVFVEHDRSAWALVRSNLSLCGLLEQGRVEFQDVTRYLERVDPTAPFDLVLADPPYGKGLLETTLSLLTRSNWVAQAGVVVCEGERDLVLPEKIGDLECVKRRCYGNACVYIFERMMGILTIA